MNAEARMHVRHIALALMRQDSRLLAVEAHRRAAALYLDGHRAKDYPQTP